MPSARSSPRCRVELHFRPTRGAGLRRRSRRTGSSAGPDTVEWEELSFSVNGAKWGPDRPGLPLLQAEKVLSLPLDLRLNADYRYRLERTDTVGERLCYVVAFDPSDLTQSRYRGWVWIDTVSFLRLKVQTIQTHLEGPIVSSEEITTYEPVPTGRGGFVLLPRRLSTKQILLVAGRNLLLEKEQWFSDFRIDPPEFESERQAARASRHIMFRDTDAGVRYLVKRGAERVVSDELTTSSKALAMGTTIDPSFAFPLPILGHQLSQLRCQGQRQSAGAALWRRLPARQPAGAEAREDAVRSERGLLWHRGAGHRSAFRRRRRAPQRARAHDSDVDRRQPRLSVHARFRSSRPATRCATTRTFARPRPPDDFVVPSNTATHGASVGLRVQPARLPDRRPPSRRTRVNPGPRGGPPATFEATGRRIDATRSARRRTFSSVRSSRSTSARPGTAARGSIGSACISSGCSTRSACTVSQRRASDSPSWRSRAGRTRSTSSGFYRLDLFLDRARGRDPNRARPVAIGDRHRRGGDLQDAVEYDVHRRRRQELDPRPLSRDADRPCYSSSFSSRSDAMR